MHLPCKKMENDENTKTQSQNRKLKTELNKLHQKPRMITCAQKGQTDPAEYATPVVLLI